MPISRRRLATIAAPLVTLAVVITIVVVATSDDNNPRARSASSSTAPRSTTTPGPSTTSAGSATTAAGGPSPSGIPTRAEGRFTIVGHQIVGPDGNIFVPMGANVGVRQGQWETGYAFNWNGTATDHVADVKAWGWNLVRATLVCDLDGSGPTEAELDAGIDAFIEEYTTQRVVVMVECHDLTGKNLAPSDAKVKTLDRFWDRLAERWHDNPYVWFNTYNEPQGSADATGVANWLALQRDALQRLRSKAPDSVFVADIPGAAQGLQTFTGATPITQLGDGQCNVLYGWHSYGAVGKDGVFGNEADYGNETASRANHLAAFEYLRDHNIPVVIGEFGDPLTLDEGNAGQPIWNRIGARAVIDMAPKFGVGLIWWHGTGDSGIFLTYSLMAERHSAPWSAATSGEGLSDGGRRFWEASKHQPAPVRFTGNLADSNCP